MGRPREYDRDQIAKDLIEWAKLPDSINLNKFCALHDPIIPPSYITDWARECKNFSAAYESAKLFLGFRREEMLNSEQLHVKAYDLNATTYDYFLKEEKRKQAEFESSLKKDEEGAKQSTYTIVVPNDLATGLNLSASSISNSPDKGAK